MKLHYCKNNSETDSETRIL